MSINKILKALEEATAYPVSGGKIQEGIIWMPPGVDDPDDRWRRIQW